MITNYLKIDSSTNRTLIRSDDLDAKNYIPFQDVVLGTNYGEAGSFLFDVKRLLAPYSTINLDKSLPLNYNNCYSKSLSFSFRVFSRLYSYLTICTNGTIKFDKSSTILAPFNQNLFTNLGAGGNIFFRSVHYSNNSSKLFDSLSDIIIQAYPYSYPNSLYNATRAFIIKWDQVNEFNSGPLLKKNSFQIIVLPDSTDRQNYLIVNYGQLGSKPIYTRFRDGYNSANNIEFDGGTFKSNIVNTPGRFLFLSRVEMLYQQLCQCLQLFRVRVFLSFLSIFFLSNFHFNNLILIQKKNKKNSNW